ncbi:hypothetical protein ACFO1B_57515, partial [Dactylosporangium siamense]|uniref:hypothetical protein n=1 Tax=Dactylosporangium siamense TaxID=685454 RepID=UPI00361CC7E8
NKSQSPTGKVIASLQRPLEAPVSTETVRCAPPKRGTRDARLGLRMLISLIQPKKFIFFFVMI